jgi:hypothetical protein
MHGLKDKTRDDIWKEAQAPFRPRKERWAVLLLVGLVIATCAVGVIGTLQARETAKVAKEAGYTHKPK